MVEAIKTIFLDSTKFYTLVGLATAYVLYLFVALRVHSNIASMVFRSNKELGVPQRYVYSCMEGGGNLPWCSFRSIRAAEERNKG